MLFFISCKEKKQRNENQMVIKTNKITLKADKPEKETEKTKKFYKIKINEKYVIIVSPDEKAIDKIKGEMGENNFYTMTDDIMFYQSELLDILDSLNIKHIQTDKRLIEIKTPNEIIRFNADTSSIKWKYFYFDGKEIKEKEIFDLLDLENNIQANKKETKQEVCAFKKFVKYQMNDTIKIDIDGDNKIEQIYFNNKDCKKLIIEKENKAKLTFGCGEKKEIAFLKNINWVDHWCVVYDKEVWQVLFKKDGDIYKDTIIKLERPSIYIGKKDEGGGIITYKKGKIYWIHQAE